MSKKKTYIIAEVGINHNGSLDNALRMIDAAAKAGCDAVKVQFFKAKYLYPRNAGSLDWENPKGSYAYDIYSACKSFELPEAWIDILIKYCRKKRIDFLSSVFDLQGLKFLISKGMKQIKLSSYAITNIPLITSCAKYRLPIIMSTGGATLAEIEEAVGAVNRYHNRLSLLHCSIKYPTRLNQCNLGVIKTLRYAFPYNRIGYSDHTKETSTAAVQAVYLGAEIIEKHITLDKKMAGPDHFFALESLQLKKMVSKIREAERRISNGGGKINKKLYGSSAKITFPHEQYLRDFCFPAIFSARDIRKGERIRAADLHILRPGKRVRGLEPKYLWLFEHKPIVAKRTILKENPITWDSIL